VKVGLTDQQQKVLTFIVKQMRSLGHPPTIREIGDEFGFRSTGTVRDHLRALETKGYLRTMRHKSRGLLPREWLRTMPILGRVPAGGPLLTEENVEGTLDLANEFGSDKVFALKVRGDSMQDDGIREDDLVVVRAQQRVEPDQVVVALVDGEATVKKLTNRDERLWLEPANPRYKPIAVDDATRIVGKVIGVIRSYEHKF
jgi:repressor LexA